MPALVRNILGSIFAANKVTSSKSAPSHSEVEKPFQLGKAFIFLGLTAVGIWLFFYLLSIFLRYLPEPIGSRADLFSEGAQTTLWLTVTSGGIGLVLGILAGLAKVQKNWLFRAPTELYIWAVRGTPLLVQILFVYYAVPALLPWLRLNEFYAAMTALALNVGAYNAEVVRAGIIAIPKGQKEASLSLGLSSFKTMRWVILPQAIRIVLPPLVNNIVALLKDSSLASAIGLLELSLAGNRISSETFRPVPVLTTVAIVYLALTTALSILTHFLDRHLNVRRGR
jgi:polar amino acid transport system permease protein